ncbi:MAG: hypothetical protein LBJ93_02515 [Clostridiales bacterium]|nr:hypothetical protein [Clostridiales bacterium]
MQNPDLVSEICERFKIIGNSLAMWDVRRYLKQFNDRNRVMSEIVKVREEEYETKLAYRNEIGELIYLSANESRAEDLCKRMATCYPDNPSVAFIIKKVREYNNKPYQIRIKTSEWEFSKIRYLHPYDYAVIMFFIGTVADVDTLYTEDPNQIRELDSRYEKLPKGMRACLEIFFDTLKLESSQKISNLKSESSQIASNPEEAPEEVPDQILQRITNNKMLMDYMLFRIKQDSDDEQQMSPYMYFTLLPTFFLSNLIFAPLFVADLIKISPQGLNAAMPVIISVSITGIAAIILAVYHLGRYKSVDRRSCKKILDCREDFTQTYG